MGIPRFYRYMSERYPLINQPISDVSLLPEFDAFYLDMNGIIHNCTHSDGGDSDALSSLGLAAQLHNIFTYMDRLITHIIKPKQLVYIAIDGVAPRAKLNQQRSRRFRAGLDRQEALEKEKYLQIKLEDEKNGNRGAVEAKDKFDSNCITPGTEFLEHLSHHLVYFVRQKMKTDPLWARLEVFFSGSEVPGEGEHKIVEFIRHRKMMPGYGANVRHCMYGSDADLMLLGPMTHEPHFTLVREVVVWGSHKVKVQAKQIEEQQWQLVHLSLFREYLMMEMRVVAPLDGERMLDDFILLTFLLGNDFIPHSPTLEISEDAIPLLLQVYRELLEKHQGQYLTENGKLVNIELLQELFHVIGSQEEDILTNRAIEESKKKHRGGPRGGRNERPITTHDVNEDLVQNAILALNDSDDEDRPPPLLDDEDEDEDEDEKEKALLEALDGELETKLALEVEEEEHQLFAELSGSQSFQDTKWAYYERKFKLTRGDGNAHNKGLEEIKKHYVEALMWCIAYYFQGPPSWSWFYPYHYAPMVSDLTNISEIAAKIKFNNDPETDGPLLPFEQLMSNLPASSAHLVPEPYRFLMVSPLSPIKHFYPETFDIDMEGKKNSWEGVNILPFIDVTLLKQAIAQYCPDSRLTQSERRRNTLKMRPLRIVLDLGVVDTLPSSLPGVPGFPDIPMCNTRVEDFTLPPITVHGGQFQSRLMDGVTLPLAGFPSLYTVPLEAVRIDHVRLNCFGMASRKATFILQVGPTSVTESGASVVPPQNLISKTVLVNWPNLHEALVVGVSSLAGEYRRKKNAKGKKEVVFTPYENDEKTSWAYYAQSEVVKLLSGRGSPGSGGIDLGKSGISTVLHVLPLQGMVSNPLTGAIEKKFGDVEALVPYQLAVVNRKLHDDRFQETGKLALAERFPPKSVALITNGEWLGCTAEVVECDEDENEIKVRVNTIDKEPPFGYVVAEKITDKYFPGYLVAQKLGISTTTLGVLTGNVNVNPGGFDIGLNIRFRKDLLLPGYCRLVNRTSPQQGGHKDASEEANVWRKGDIVKIVGSGEYDAALKKDSQQLQRNGGGSGGGAANGSSTVWEYSERAVKLLAAYKAEFPAIVSKLDKLPFGTSYNGKELFGVRDGKEIEIKAELVKVWIEQQHLGGKEHSKHIPVTSEYLSLSAIRAVEAAGALRATERQKHAAQNQVKPVEALIPAHHLFRPNPLVNQDLTGSEVSRRATKNPGAPKLGDRIININGRGIPFGHRGTVVATHVSSKCIEVLFDEKFTGGEPLYGTVSLDRGKIVSWNNVICVSTPPGSQGARSASSVDASHRQYASKNGLPRANDGSVKILSKSKNDSSRKGSKKETSSNGNALRVSSNSGVPAVPPPPPIPSSLPPPPDASKMQMLLEKWTGGEAASADGSAAKDSPKPKSQKKSTKKDSPTKTTTTAEPAVTESVPVAPATAVNPEIAPSVMAFFSAAQASGVELQPAAPQSPAPSAAMLDLFPHNYAGAPGAHSLMAPPPPPPQGAYGHPVFVPHLLVPQAMPPPPPHHHHAFINPYQPPPPPLGAHAYMVNTGAQQYAAPPVPPTEPKLSEDEYPTLATAATTKASKKTQVAIITAKTTVVSTTEAGVTVVVSEEQKKKTSRSKQQTPKSKKPTTAAATGKEKVWVPKTAVETEPKAAKPSGGPHLLLPAQVLRHQQQKQQGSARKSRASHRGRGVMVQSEDQEGALPEFALKLDDDFPCGSAYRAIRSPRTSSSSDLLKRFQHSDSETSIESASSSNSDRQQQRTAAEPGNNNQALPTAAAGARTATEQDLAKRAQRRVIDHKRSELEKKHELEKVRQKKLESEKLKKERTSQLKNRRRAEIYALNAIMKQVQQDNITKFLHAQKQLRGDCTKDATTGGGSSNLLHQTIHSIGV